MLMEGVIQVMMTGDSLQSITELLRKLPGIGPRQARRLAFWFVQQDEGWVDSFARVLLSARKSVTTCDFCKRLFPKESSLTLCPICASRARDTSVVLLVEKDVDLENIEKTGAYRGRYFVLGGTTSPLDKDPTKKIRVEALERVLKSDTESIREIIYALSATTEGEDTILYLEGRLRGIVHDKKIVTTKLGRGLSTGTELEYVDKDTMTHALKSRA